VQASGVRRKEPPTIVSHPVGPAIERPVARRVAPRPPGCRPRRTQSRSAAAQQGPKRLKGPGLGFGATLFDNGPMQGVACDRAAGKVAAARWCSSQTASPSPGASCSDQRFAATGVWPGSTQPLCRGEIQAGGEGTKGVARSGLEMKKLPRAHQP